MEFWNTNRSHHLYQTIRSSGCQHKKKRTYWIVNFDVPAHQRKKKSKEGEKKDKYVDLVEKKMEYEGDGDTNSNWCTRNNLQIFERGLDDVEIRGQKWGSPDHRIGKISQKKKKKKSPGYKRRLAVTQLPVRNHQTTVGVKKLRGEKL